MLVAAKAAAAAGAIKTVLERSAMATMTLTMTHRTSRFSASAASGGKRTAPFLPMMRIGRQQLAPPRPVLLLRRSSARRPLTTTTKTTTAAAKEGPSSSPPPPPQPPRSASRWLSSSAAAALLAAAAFSFSAVQPAEALRSPFAVSSPPTENVTTASAAAAAAEETSPPPPPSVSAAALEQLQRHPSSLDMVPPSPELDRDLSAEDLASVRLFRGATPSVVNIANLVSVGGRGYGSMDATRVPRGTGSGFIWNRDGIVVTNYHVVRGAEEIKVALIDSSVWSARFLAGDPDKDVAVLRLLAPPEVVRALKPVTLGSSAGLQVGQKTYALGNPFGLDHSMSTGIISGLGRELASPNEGSYASRGTTLRGIIQTDAAINPGNSGGVLLDSKGRLIGINTAIADPSGRGGSVGVGFAIPIDTVRGLVEQILTYGKIVRPVLGISIAPPQTLRQIGETGVLILDVPPGTPAAAAGIRGTSRDERGQMVLGDIITSLDGKEVKSQRDLFGALDERRPGDKVRVGVTRGGKKGVEVDVVLGGREIGRDE